MAAADSETDPTDPNPSPSNADASRPAFALGPFTVHPEALCVRNAGQITTLQQKEMALLLALVERAEDSGRPMSSTELRKKIWGEQAITDSAAKNLVWQLRASLKESADAPVLIETVPGAGYRLTERPRPIVRVEQTSGSPVSGPATTAEKSTDRRRTALWATIFIALCGALLYVGFLYLPADPGGSATSLEPIDSFTYGPPSTIVGLAGREWSIDLDPSGRFLVFSWSKKAGEPADLYRIDLRTQAPLPVQLTRSDSLDETGARWSADGRQIAFVSHEVDSENYEIRVMPTAGGSSKVLTALPSRRPPNLAWQVDGGSLIIDSNHDPDQPFGLYRLDFGSGVLNPLPFSGEPAFDHTSPTLSPDGTSLAFIRWASPHATSIRVRNLRTGAEHTAADDLPRIATLDWHADGRRLLFTSRIKSSSSIWQVPADGSAEPTLFPPAAGALDIGEVTVAQSGRVAFEQSFFDVEILRFDGLRDGRFEQESRPIRQVSSDRAELAYSPSPDGRRAVFLSNRTGALGLWLAEGDNPPRRLLVEGVSATSRPSWSPDGSLVALSLLVGEQSEIALIRWDTGEVQWVTETAARELAPSWRQDGLALRFSVPSENGWSLWEQELWNPKSRYELAPGGQASQALTDGRTLYSHVGQGLFLLGPDGEPQLLDVDVGVDDWDNWRATDSGIYSLRVGKTTVRYYDFATGETSNVIDLDYPASRSALAVSADGQSLFVAVVTRDTSELLTLPVTRGPGDATPADGTRRPLGRGLR